MTTAIIIVNYKTPWHLKECLKSIFEHTTDFHIFLVHNSIDPESIKVSVEFEAQYPKQITVVKHEHNLGLVGGVNSVYEQAIKYERICFLNSDIIVTENWLKELNNVIDEDPSVVQVAPDFNHYYQDPKIWRYVRYTITPKFPKLGARLYKIFMKRNPPRAKDKDRGFVASEEIYNFCSGACNLVQSKCFKERGYFWDPNIIHGYGDDFDTSFYLRKFGKVGATNRSYVFHFLNVSFNKLDPEKANAKAMLQKLNRFYVVDKSADEIKSFLESLSRDELLRLSDVAQEVKLWIEYFGIIAVDKDFSSYIKSLPAKEYAKKLGIWTE